MNKKYEVMLLCDIDITDTERMINWCDQGWQPYDTSEYHSFMITVCQIIVVETDRIEMYINAINKMSRDIRVAWFEEITYPISSN